MKVILVIINCNSRKEAERIGKAVLKKRLAGCSDIFPRLASYYFWPPKSGKIEKGKGSTLVCTTSSQHVQRITSLVKQLHSDTIPFIGCIELRDINSDYIRWLQSEI